MLVLSPDTGWNTKGFQVKQTLYLSESDRYTSELKYISQLEENLSKDINLCGNNHSNFRLALNLDQIWARVKKIILETIPKIMRATFEWESVKKYGKFVPPRNSTLLH